MTAHSVGAHSTGGVPLQNRSASHYLTEGPQRAHLQATAVLTARALGFPIAVINILDSNRQHTIGWSADGDAVSIRREDALCDVVVSSGQTLVIEDAATDIRFGGYPSVLDGAVGSYAAVPLTGRESLVVGTLCVIDPHPRRVDAAQLSLLRQFGTIVEDQLEVIRRQSERLPEPGVSTMELATAISRGDIVPWFQPVVDLSSGRTTGFEALARWQHPSGRIVGPDRFIPVAEDSDLIVDLDLTIMSQALEQLSVWHLLDDTLRMGINVSGRHFEDKQFPSLIEGVIVRSGISPALVDIELTEATRLEAGTGVALIHDLADLGVKVWLDDFGTGWSTLEHLLRLPVDGVKIDKRMAAALGSPVGDAVIKAVTGLAADLGLTTTIEGVENADQAGRATTLGCVNGQGFWWSAPAPAGTTNPSARLGAF